MVRIVNILRFSDTLSIINVKILAIFRKLEETVEGTYRLYLVLKGIIILYTFDPSFHETLSNFFNRTQIRMPGINFCHISLVLKILFVKQR